ncbi:MAG: RND family transporter [Actinobacteria bacterium]|nr:RND family transporter [Actinomycetota bacterium]
MKIFEFLASQSEKRPWLVIAITALVTVFLMAGFPRLSTELSQEAMMPKHYDSIKAWDEVKDVFGGVSSEIALVTAENVADPEVARALLSMDPSDAEENGVPGGSVLKVETYLDFIKYRLPEMLAAVGIDAPIDPGAVDDASLTQFLDFYLDPRPDSPFLDLMAAFTGGLDEEQRAGILAVFQENRERIAGMISDDATATMLRFQLDPDLSENALTALAKDLESYVSGKLAGIEGVSVYYSGDASFQKDSQEFMQKETSKLMLIALLFVMLILYLTFRRLSDIGLPLLIILVAIFWIIGVMGWAGITYTTMSVAIMPLMLGINIAYVIHILSRYYEEREGGASVDLSATTSVKTVGVAVFLTAITTLFGFSSFMITDMPPMRDFGLLCMMGIAFSFLLSLTLLPAIIVIRDRRKREEKQQAHLEKMRRRRRDSRYGTAIDNVLVRMAMLSEHNHWAVALVTLSLVAFATFAVFNVRTGADVRKMMPEDMPSMKASEMITEIFGPQNSDVILAWGDIYDPKNLAAILELEDSIPLDPRNLPESEYYFARDRISSIADYILMASPDGKLPDTREGVTAVVEQLSLRMPVGSFVGEKDGEYVAMIMLNSGFPETEDEMRVKTNILRDRSAAVAEKSGLRFSSTGFTVLVADLLGNIVPTQLETSGLALLLCALVLILVFKSFIYGICTLVVVVCGMAAELLFLFALGWPLDLMTVMVASLVIGAGIDFGIHITHRFREERHVNGSDVEEAIRNTVKHVGRALVAAALTTMGVFFILGLSNMGMMQRFGFTTTVGLLGALLGAILVLPSVLAIVAGRINGADAPRRNAVGGSD